LRDEWRLFARTFPQSREAWAMARHQTNKENTMLRKFAGALIATALIAGPAFAATSADNSAVKPVTAAAHHHAIAKHAKLTKHAKSAKHTKTVHARKHAHKHVAHGKLHHVKQARHLKPATAPKATTSKATTSKTSLSKAPAKVIKS
jgi:hypothetical protein